MIDDIKMVNSDGKEVSSSPRDIGSTEGSVVNSGGLFDATVAKVLGMDVSSLTSQYKSELEDIISYAKAQTGKDELTNDKLAWILSQLDLSIGASPFAEKRIHKVARFIRLNKQKSQIEAELSTYGAY